MSYQNGTPIWNLGKPAEKQKLTAEMIQKKTVEVSKRFADLITAFGLGVNILADERDPLGMFCFSTIIKQLLADGVGRCADNVDAAQIME